MSPLSPVQSILIVLAILIVPEVLLAIRSMRSGSLAPTSVTGPVGRLLLPYLTTKDLETGLRQKLDAAGLRRLTVGAFRARQLSIASLGAGVGAFFLLIGAPALPGLALTALLAAVGWRWPYIDIGRRAKRRRVMMFLETPLFFSAVANRVLSGVDLMRALRQEAQEGEGPLREEVRHAFLVVDTLGTPAQDALMDAARRTGLTTIVDLFGVLVQASERGAAGAADTLLEGAARASEELRLAVEDSKGRALLRGTAMAVLFELPPLMVVSVGPALFMAIQGMAQTGR